MLASDFKNKVDKSHKRSKDVELEKFEKENGISLEEALNTFLSNGYNGYNTEECLYLSVVHKRIKPAGEWKETTEEDYDDRVFSTGREYKRREVDGKSKSYIYYTRVSSREISIGFETLHEVLRKFTKAYLIEREYYIIEKVEPSYEVGGYSRPSYKYLEVYYDKDTYDMAYKGITKDVKELIKLTEELLGRVKGSQL